MALKTTFELRDGYASARHEARWSAAAAAGGAGADCCATVDASSWRNAAALHRGSWSIDAGCNKAINNNRCNASPLGGRLGNQLGIVGNSERRHGSARQDTTRDAVSRMLCLALSLSMPRGETETLWAARFAWP